MLCEHMDSREVCEKCALIAMRERAEKAEEREAASHSEAHASAKENQAMAEHIERQAEIIDSVALIIGTRGEDPGDIDGFEVLRLHARALADACQQAEHDRDEAQALLEAAATREAAWLDAAWAATGVAGSVRGLTTLDDVIKVQRTDLINALERITELESELQDADQVMQDALGHERHRHRAAIAAEREKVRVLREAFDQSMSVNRSRS